jgi:hypothetical protein
VSHIVLFLTNLLSLPHLHVTKTKDGEPLVNYSQSQYVITFNEYGYIFYNRMPWKKRLPKKLKKKKKGENMKVKRVINSLTTIKKTTQR